MIYKLLLFLGIILNVIAQIFLKVSVKNDVFIGENVSLINKVINLFLKPFFILSLIIYGTSFIIYSITLSKLELSKAYPVSSAGAIILILVFSIIFLSESFTLYKIIGVSLCIIGIFLIFK